ncbi:hypothetical protein [Kitasatospora sp. DSM 101779]|uniref:hypothetical protein n=1 Tax=Kitasatospora sp. DSM 101779 TaxID=2853165 RepID=UPI0021DB0617|nr:hypothetical protein [Kitasatospora sp. DSM 101779]MCU7820746.1 hypothetical protein [Kitasatospora sp. DSM 101779]
MTDHQVLATVSAPLGNRRSLHRTEARATALVPPPAAAADVRAEPEHARTTGNCRAALQYLD